MKLTEKEIGLFVWRLFQFTVVGIIGWIFIKAGCLSIGFWLVLTGTGSALGWLFFRNIHNLLQQIRQKPHQALSYRNHNRMQPEDIMDLTIENVDEAFRYCLFKKGEEHLHGTALIAESAALKIGFHPDRIAERTLDIAAMLEELPEEFSAGGGWAFVEAVVTGDGEPWGGQHDADKLLALGIAAGLAEVQLRAPGCVLYFRVK